MSFGYNPGDEKERGERERGERERANPQEF
jgi:hypothetical protein